MNGRTRTVARRPGRPKGGHLIADRARLLEVAERTIEEHGIDVTMEAIASAASVTKPIVYRSVGDRDALVVALSERFAERVNSAAAARTAEATGRRDVMVAILRSFVDVVDRQPNLFLFLTAGARTGDRVGHALSVGDLSASPLAEVLSRLSGRAEPIDPLSSLIWARGIIGASQYAALWWLRDRSCSADELAERLTTLIWSGIAGEG